MKRLSSRGIIVEQISITNFEFSQQFSQAIEQKVTAQQNALKAENDLKRIEIEARQKVATAEGDKQATILSAEGKAKEIEIIQRQLQTSPTYIQYLATRQWDGKITTGNRWCNTVSTITYIESGIMNTLSNLWFFVETQWKNKC